MKIAIAGYGLEGQSSYRYWSRQQDAQLTIVDERPVDESALPLGVETIFGEGAFGQLEDFDLVIRTAGLSPYKIKTNGKVWSATNEFFALCPATIIGVTGSKGKGTTASLIASMLRADGYTVWMVGNIGKPALDVLDQIQPDHIVVYELSSFQLWDIERSPQTAVVLFIEQEHLDVHPNMADYVAAKARITRFQSKDDRLIYLAENEYSRAIADQSQARLIPFPSSQTAHLSEGDFWYGEQLLCSVDILKLRGEHNHINAIAAIDAVWPLIHHSESIPAGLAAFEGLPHRLQYVATVRDVEYYDDSIATTPSSAIAALRAFPLDQPKVIILGGSFKGSDFSELATEIRRQPVKALLIGQEATRIAELLEASSYEIIETQTMPAIVQRSAEIAQPGSVVLLSPAAASFGLFDNYADRGDQFIMAVNQLAN